jgi:hypothetical protein
MIQGITERHWEKKKDFCSVDIWDVGGKWTNNKFPKNCQENQIENNQA